MPFTASRCEIFYIEGNLKAWCEIYFEPLWISGNTYSSFSFDCNPIKPATNIWINGEMVEEDFEIPEGVTKIGRAWPSRILSTAE